MRRAAGRRTIRTRGRLVTEANMPNLNLPDMRAAFAAGRTGLHVTSTSDLAKVAEMVGGEFAPKTAPSPSTVPQAAMSP